MFAFSILSPLQFIPDLIGKELMDQPYLFQLFSLFLQHVLLHKPKVFQQHVPIHFHELPVLNAPPLDLA